MGLSPSAQGGYPSLDFGPVIVGSGAKIRFDLSAIDTAIAGDATLSLLIRADLNSWFEFVDVSVDARRWAASMATTPATMPSISQMTPARS